MNHTDPMNHTDEPTNHVEPYRSSRRLRHAVLRLFPAVVALSFVPFVVRAVHYLTDPHPAYVPSDCPPPGSGWMMPTTGVSGSTTTPGARI